MRKFLLCVCLLLFTVSCQTMESGRIRKSSVTPEEVADSLRKIRQWEEYMNLFGDSDVSVRTVLGLTEGYLDARDLLFKKDLEEYEVDMELYGKGMLKKKPERPVYDYNELIRRFTAFRDRYQYGRGADAIRYVLGYALYEQGRRDSAVEVFEDLVKNYPASEYMGEVSFRLGEFYFETNQVEEARQAYARILNDPMSNFYENALYKLGWVYYKLGDLRQSLDMFIAVADRRWDGSLKADGLMDESVNCIIMTMGRFKEMEKVAGYLEPMRAREYTPLVLDRFGSSLVEQTRYDDAIFIYRFITSRFPDIPTAPFVYDSLADLYERTGNEKEALELKLEMARLFNPATRWYAEHYPGRSEKVDGLVSGALVDASKEFHIRGKKPGGNASLDSAIEGYGMFMEHFPGSKELNEITLLRAEALFDAGRYAEAAGQYEKAAAKYPAGPQRDEIIYSAFLSRELQFNGSSEDREEPVLAADRLLSAYEDEVMKNPRLRSVVFRLSGMYGQTGDYGRARTSLAPLLSGKDSGEANRAMAELYVKEGNLAEAEKIYAVLARGPGAQAYGERLAVLRYMMAESMLKDGDRESAAAMFGKAYSTAEDSATGLAALVKLGSIHISRKDAAGIEDVARGLLKKYPATDPTLSFLVESGKALEETFPLKSAWLYASAASVARNSGDRKRLTLASAALYGEFREHGKAAAALEAYLASQDVPPADSVAASYWLGRALVEAGEEKKGLEILSRLASRMDAGGDIPPLRAAVFLLERKQRAYMDMALTQPFEEMFDKKIRALDSLVKEYTGVARSNAQEILPEVFYQMGSLMENFRDSITRSERPDGLSEEQLAEYSFLIEEKAYPYDEQAVKVYEKCVKLARKATIYDKWTRNCYDRLAYLRPAIYRRPFEDVAMEPVVIAPEPVPLKWKP